MHYSVPSAPWALRLAFFVMGIVVPSVAIMLLARSQRALGRSATQMRAVALVAAVAFILWSSLWLGLANAGVLARFDVRPPPAVAMMVAVSLVGVGIACSRVGQWLATGLSTTAVIAFQSFRLPLELAMHQAASQGVMPAQMSYTGYNFDVLTGLAALLVLVVYRHREPPRVVSVAFALLGSALLAVVVAIALASTPMFRAFGDEPQRVNTWIFSAPFVLLPSVLVLLALVFQIVLIRRLLRT